MTEVKEAARPIIDRAIEFVSPAWAARREVGRMQLSAVRQQASMSHRGGIQTRTSTPWGHSISYANGTIGGRLNQFGRRDRARKVFQENAIGRGILQCETDNVIADGFTLQMATVDPAFNREAEERYGEWTDVADIRGLRCGHDHERQVYRSCRRDGDGGVVLVDRGGESRVQFVPGDLLCTPDEKAGDASIVDGVEVDGVGRGQAFWVKSEDERGGRSWTRVPASNFIYMAPEIDEDLGVRGDSCYSQIFGYLDGIDGYIDAVIIAARMAAVFGLIFKEESPAQAMAGLAGTTNSAGQQQKAVTLENGSIKYAGTKGEVVQVQAQQPMSQTPDFIRAMLRLCGLPFDMPLELVAHDMSQVNFASARIGLLGFYRACRSRQRSFRVRYLQRRFQWWLSRERKKQDLGLDGSFVTAFPAKYYPHRFIAQGWDYTDPVSEAQGDQLQIDMGTKTPQMVAAERGREWEVMQEQLAVARMTRRLKQLGEVRSTMTRDVVEVATAGAVPEDVTWKREVLKSLLTVPAAREAVYNGTDIKDLIAQTGLNPENGYEVPYIPVVASTGPLVSGATINDPQGNIVGGDIENEAPAEDPAVAPTANPDPKEQP